jgi:NitT/TauT family transport system substrate-binding protein
MTTNRRSTWSAGLPTVMATALALALLACTPATPTPTSPTAPPAAGAPTQPAAKPAATAPTVPTPAAAAKKAKIRVAFGLPLGNSSNPFAWIGQELGYFDEEGIEADIVSTSGNNAQADAMLLSNQIDIGIFGLDPILRPAATGKSLPARAVFNVQNRSQYEGIVQPDSPIKTLADLKGKKVGIPELGGSLEIYVNAVLADAGLQPSDVEYLATSIGVPMGEALKRGDIDVGYATRGQIGPLELRGYQLRFLPRPKFAEEFITGNVVARTELTPETVGALKGYLRAYAKSIVFTKENPEAAIRISWKMYPDGKPRGVPEDQAIQDAVKTNQAYMSYIDKAEGKWGYMPPDKIKFYANYLGVGDKIPDLTKYYTNEYIDFVNTFDEEKVKQQARNWKP